MKNVLKTLYDLPPKMILRQIRRKLSVRSEKTYHLEDVLESPKYMRPQRMFDFLNRYQLILKRNLNWKDLDFMDRRVGEIGAGPLLGWGPLAVFLGCKSYTCVEPMFNPSVLESHAVIDKYFLPLYKDLCAIYGRKESFERFFESITEKVSVSIDEFLSANIDGPFDIVLSNSCLEHVFPLDRTLQKLREMCVSDVRFIHLVDFGNHRGTRGPFDGMYSMEPEEYWAKYGKKINLTRAPDVLRCLREAGFNAVMVPYYSYKEHYDEKIHPYWLERYNEEDLFLKAALFADAVSPQQDHL